MVAPKQEPESGQRISRYQLVAPIGVGGMGQVWVALDTAAPALRLVALKTALRESTNDREFLAIVNDEARLASRIQHPNVCATYEFGEADGSHYLVMDWSDGASLRDLLDALPGHRLEPVLAAHITASVAAGLHAAHELTGEDGQPLGVVHRDVSPHNVLLSSRGHIHLADFGVAKARGQTHRATETGEVKGKLAYMSPEQVASKPIDRRSDVFALGCVLYESVLGVRPFHGGDALATMYQILEQDLVLPSSLDATFPEGLERILSKALAKLPAERYGTADEFRVALLEYVASTRRYVADKHTAELLDQTLGPKLRQRNRAIIDLAARLRKGETDPAKLRSPPAPPPQRSVTPDGGVERTISEFTATRQAQGRPLRFVLGGATLAVAISILVFALRAEHRSVAPDVVAGTAPVAAALVSPSAASAALASVVPAAVPPPAAPSATAGTEVIEVFGADARPESTAHAGQRPNLGRASRSTPAAVQSSSTPSKHSGARGPRPIDEVNPFLAH